MQIRAKFKCVRIETFETGDGGTGHNANFSPVSSGSKENEEFYKYTPGGELKISCTRQQHFQAGKEYYLDITEVPPATAPAV